MAVSEQTRHDLKHVGITALCWLALWAVMFGSAFLMFNHRFMEESSETTNGLLPLTFYYVNWPLYLLGAGVTVAAYLLIRKKWLRGCTVHAMERSAQWQAAFFLQTAFGLIGLFIAEMAGNLTFMDWKATKPPILEYYILPYIAMILIITAADVVICLRRRK